MCICDPNKRTPRCENCPITQTSDAEWALGVDPADLLKEVKA